MRLGGSGAGVGCAAECLISDWVYRNGFIAGKQRRGVSCAVIAGFGSMVNRNLTFWSCLFLSLRVLLLRHGFAGSFFHVLGAMAQCAMIRFYIQSNYHEKS